MTYYNTDVPLNGPFAAIAKRAMGLFNGVLLLGWFVVSAAAGGPRVFVGVCVHAGLGFAAQNIDRQGHAQL